MPRCHRSENGFTLVELLVVVVVVGILAAIALPAFLGHKHGASDAKAKTDLSNAQRALELHWTQHDNYTVTRADLVALEPSVGSALNLTVSGTDSSYRLAAEARRGATFVIEKSTSAVDRTCAPAGTGGCDADGSW